jgi:hypothetical protein
VLNERVLALSDATFAETAGAWGFATDDSRTVAVTYEFASATNAQMVHADEWNRLPWLPDEPRTARAGIDFELVAWAFGATLLIASTSYSAGRASLANGAGPYPLETVRRSLASTTERLLAKVPSAGYAGLFEPGGKSRDRVASNPVMTAEEADKVAAELTLVQDITSGPYDPSPEPNAPY